MRKSLGLLTILFVCLAAWSLPAAANNCKRPRAMIVLDKSSSMITGQVDGTSKWEVAKTALAQVLNAYDSSVDFGLMLFPSPSQCGAGTVKVGVAPNNAQAILDELNEAPPAAGNWTPMAQSLDAAAQLAELNDTGYANHVLLITDGWQWCSPYDVSSRFLPVNAVTNLTNLKISSWVVGFGDSVDALTLNKMADAAGTSASVGCNVASEDAKAADNCYYSANDPTQLVQALQNVVSQISNEVCDGADNNCNGQIDEGLAGPACVKQKGVCAGAAKACGGETGWSSCTAADYDKHAANSGNKYESAESICDGKDNDCDGTVDEGCSCVNGQTRPCGVNVGECKPGTQVCANGAWGGCTGEVKANTEVCDGRDNDCDGVPDEELTRDCSTECGPGTETCQAGQWTGCTAQTPSGEICDGLDNDCDGLVDDTAVCDNGGVCVAGVCQPGGTSSGCDCELGTTGGDGAPLPLVGLLLAGLLLAFRRRR